MEEIPIIYPLRFDDLLTFQPRKGYGVVYMYECDGKKYIGQTCKTLYYRHKQHLKRELAIDLKIQHHPFALCILWAGNFGRLDEMEQYYITKYDTIWPNGWNMTCGGQNSYEFSEETRRKKSAIAKAKGQVPPGMKGKPSPLKGRKLSKAQKDARMKKLLENHPDYWEKMDRTMSSGANQHRSHAVYQRDREGNIIARYDTITAAVKATGASQTMISRCLKGVCKTAGGYIWTNTEESAQKFNATIDVPKLTKIQQFDMNGNLIAEYKNTIEAGKAVNTHPRNISKAVCGFSKTCAGYIWKKVEV